MRKKPIIVWGVEELYHPEPGTMSEGAYYRLLHEYSQIPNFPPHVYEKRSLLYLLGLEDDEIERMCKPKELKEEDVKREIGELVLKEREELRKWDKQRRLEEQQRLKVDGYL